MTEEIKNEEIKNEEKPITQKKKVVDWKTRRLKAINGLSDAIKAEKLAKQLFKR